MGATQLKWADGLQPCLFTLLYLFHPPAVTSALPATHLDTHKSQAVCCLLFGSMLFLFGEIRVEVLHAALEYLFSMYALFSLSHLLTRTHTISLYLRCHTCT